jgi:protein gp37
MGCDPAGRAQQPRLASERNPGDGSSRRGSGVSDWFESSWNPTAGCSLVSPGCDHCYAMRIATRLARMGGKTGARYDGLTRMERSGPRWTGVARIAEELLGWPLTQRRPRRIGVSVLSDLFYEGLATETVDLVHAVMRAAHWHRFLVLTKRSARMRAYYSDPQTPGRIAEKHELLSTLVGPSGRSERLMARSAEVMRPAGLGPWPLPHLWIGVSIEDQDRIARVNDLLDTPAAIRWVCCEPMLDRIQLDAVPVGGGYFDAIGGGHYAIDGRGRRVSVDGPAWRTLDWIVVGGEIGADARPMQPRWVREVQDRCLAKQLPFFFRQWGEWAPTGESQQMARLGKRAAGRLLDGQTWDETPEGQAN